ncbi:MAG: HPP family protein [Corynebacterium sp.]|uniref:HPP family protein n=1 Tax=unclassified Corynebacterium TaxID=2624378 RepID=UPI002648EA80|nr:HPP family protein [Corynebacterium sp.]MDN5582885.1 HPP family protein [Corynebacterium sp.]MDN5720325.1 HPP family protein [Corynebacterium sp.]MDN6259490.1 HPP family protein [Corynebacterium sp.]MDN6324865.1 HPP family protein [Corynebacterium sp.]
MSTPPDPYNPFIGFFTRTQPTFTPAALLVSGAAVTVVICVLGLLTEAIGHPLLMAGFAASCVLVFVLPAAPVSQPMSVLGGHLVVAVVAVLADYVLPTSWWAIGLVTGVSVMLMCALRILHPPAAVLPIVMMTSHEHWEFVLTPVMLGALIVTLAAVAYRGILRGRIRWF